MTITFIDATQGDNIHQTPLPTPTHLLPYHPHHTITSSSNLYPSPQHYEQSLPFLIFPTNQPANLPDRQGNTSAIES